MQPSRPGLAAAYLRSTLPGEPRVSRRALEQICAAEPDRLPSMSHHEHRLSAAAMIVANSRHRSSDMALRLIKAELDPRLAERDRGVPTETLALFWSAVAEGFVMAGLSRQATHAAHRAEEYASELANDALDYRVLGLLAAARALNGEFTRAESAISRAAALERKHSWQDTAASYPMLAGEVLLASAWMDTDALARLHTRLSLAPPGHMWNALTALTEAVAAGIQGRPEDGISEIVAVTHGTDAPEVPRLVHLFLMSYQATLLTGRGEPRKALWLLQGMPSSSDHTICLDLQRASAHLQLRDDRQVLTSTDGCMRLAAQHCLRTLPAILLRRAIASERLGHRDAADTAFVDAFHLMDRSGAKTPWLTLPRPELTSLVSRLRVRRPDLAQRIDDMGQRAVAVPPSTAKPHSAPKLTTRETQVALRLRGALTLADIATDLSVSRNTVKSQTASLYRKLGVSSRTEAVTALERSGLLEFPG